MAFNVGKPLTRRGNFSSGPIDVEIQGILSDFDGTIIDSTDAIVNYWQMYAISEN